MLKKLTFIINKTFLLLFVCHYRRINKIELFEYDTHLVKKRSSEIHEQKLALQIN